MKLNPQRISVLKKNLDSMKSKYSKYCNWSIAFLLGLGLVVGTGGEIKAQNEVTAPEELTEIVKGLETAANSKNLEGVMAYYSPSFKNNDGLTYDSTASAISKMWQNYSQLKYTTTIESWSKEGDKLIAETVTQISGVQQDKGRTVNLTSTIRARQDFENGKLIEQEILSEETKLTSGDRPPQVEVLIPETVNIGKKYNFDVIVTEPLENGVLLGAAREERTSSNGYLNPTALDLEPLSSGGIYKVVTAPLIPDNNWLSAIVVRGDGITLINRRVRIIETPGK
jgi:hypothetical protein